MGANPITNKFKGLMYKTKSAYSQIGEVSYCPNCSEEFPPTTLYETFDQHVTMCLENYRPTDEERLRRERKYSRKGSKDSIGSNGDQMDEDEQIIEVYHREWEIQTDLQGEQPISRKSIIYKFQFSYNPELLPKLPSSQIKLMKTPIKILYLQQKFNQRKISWKEGSEQLMFNPNTIVIDSFNILHLNMFRELKLIVTDDKVKDAGGLLREWARLVIKGLGEMGLFRPSKHSQGHLMINKETEPEDYVPDGQGNYILKKIIPDEIYRMFGVLLAKILIEKVTIPYKFDYTFLRALLGQDNSLQIEDFITLNHNIFNSLRYLKNLYQKITKIQKNILTEQENTTSQQNLKQHYEQLKDLSLTFSLIVEIDTLNQQNNSYEHQLKPNGSKIFVTTSEQLEEYIQLIMHFYAYERESHKESGKMARTIRLIVNGFQEILKDFNIGEILEPEELEIMLNGLHSEEISVEDWKAGTQYKEPFNITHKTIKYFWKYVEKLNNKEKGRLLKFVTGSENLPIFGFKNLETNRGETSCFIIESMKYDKKKNQFPKAHTCFNRLQLPLYPSQESLIHGLNAITHNEFDGVWGIQ